ncbi:hypothetical protein [Luteolibacter sp. Populi]|uniref:hypothetical protein n=1 Tax=Luteolibacter sp. Populi TaxID=3230487 RepID=UPI00346693FB
MTFPRLIFILAHLLIPSVFAVESLPAGAWAYSGFQMELPPQEIVEPLHRDFVAVAGGETYSMGLTREGRVIAWGANFDSQLNLPPSVSRGVSAISAGGRFCAALKNGGVIVWGGSSSYQPGVPAGASSGVAAISAGWTHMLALKSDGSVLAWGGNDWGQRNVPPEASGNIKAIAAGFSHSLALTVDGEVIAWGTDRPGAPAGQEAVVPVAASSGVIAIAATSHHSLALKNDGSVIEWGYSVPAGEVIYHAQAGSGITAVTGGFQHVAFLHEDGRVEAILQGSLFDYGQANVPALALSGVTAIAAGHNHNLAIRSDGTVVAWGAGVEKSPGESISPYVHRGQCAVPSFFDKEVSALAADFNHTIALMDDGSVHAWGFNNYGQTDVPTDARTGVKAVSTGNIHCVALRTDGRVVAWGGNSGGQRDVPEAALSGVTAISAAGVQTVALKDDGSVINWGNDHIMGGLTVPAEAQSGVTAIAAGYEFVVALKEGGTTVVWGSNVQGPMVIPTEAQSEVVAIAAGAEHALALTSGGKVVAWGWNFFGQTSVPQEALSGVVAIAAGQAHSVALKADGTVWIWGSNHDAQLQSGIVSGKASMIAAGGSATFRKLAVPWPSFQEAAALAGLEGAAAGSEAEPFNDGVPNLLKHAFNLSLALPYTGEVASGFPGGLPRGEFVRGETGDHWRIGFVRRKDPRLAYAPMKSTGLTQAAFEPVTADAIVEGIPGFPAWDHVTISEPVDLLTTPRFFSRVEVE